MISIGLSKDLVESASSIEDGLAKNLLLAFRSTSVLSSTVDGAFQKQAKAGAKVEDKRSCRLHEERSMNLTLSRSKRWRFDSEHSRRRRTTAVVFTVSHDRHVSARVSCFFINRHVDGQQALTDLHLGP